MCMRTRVCVCMHVNTHVLLIAFTWTRAPAFDISYGSNLLAQWTAFGILFTIPLKASVKYLPSDGEIQSSVVHISLRSLAISLYGKAGGLRRKQASIGRIPLRLCDTRDVDTFSTLGSWDYFVQTQVITGSGWANSSACGYIVEYKTTDTHTHTHMFIYMIVIEKRPKSSHQ